MGQFIDLDEEPRRLEQGLHVSMLAARASSSGFQGKAFLPLQEACIGKRRELVGGALWFSELMVRLRGRFENPDGVRETPFVDGQVTETARSSWRTRAR